MTTAYHTDIAFNAPALPATINAPLGQLDAAIAAAMTSGSGWSTTLDGTASAGQKVVPVTTTTGAVAGQVVWLYSTGGTTEPAARTIASVSAGVSITLNENLTNTYTAGTLVSASPAEIVYARGNFTTLGARIGQIESRVFDIRRYGALGGSHDDTLADQAAIDDASIAGGTVIFPFMSKVSVLTILAPNVNLLGTNGGGIQDGTVRIGSTTGATVYMSMRVRDMKFVHAGTSTTVNAIELAHVGALTIDSCSFEEYDAAVYVVPIAGGLIHVNHLIVTNCRQGWGQFLLEVPDQPGGSGVYYSMADTTINGNISMSRITNIRAVGLDGIVITGNTFFLSGAWENSTIKESNIDITCATGVLISTNQCFESGWAGIKLVRCQDFTITGNYLSWSGQRDMNSSILIDGGDQAGLAQNLGTITGNTMIWPSLHGIAIYGICAVITIQGNVIFSAGANHWYNGTPAQGTVAHYGVMEAGTATKILVVGNMSPNNVLALDASNSHHANNFASNGVY